MADLILNSFKKPKTQNKERKNTMSLVEPPKRPQGENKAKDLSKKDMSPIFILENKYL